MSDTISFNAQTMTMLVGTRRWPTRLIDGGSMPTHNMGRDYGWADTHESRVHRIHFENGWTVSVIWGSMTYSDNYDHPAGNYRLDPSVRPKATFTETPRCVEAAVFCDCGDDSDMVGNEPYGYLSADELNLLLDSVMALQSDDRPSWDDLNPRDEPPRGDDFPQMTTQELAAAAALLPPREEPPHEIQTDDPG